MHYLTILIKSFKYKLFQTFKIYAFIRDIPKNVYIHMYMADIHSNF